MSVYLFDFQFLQKFGYLEVIFPGNSTQKHCVLRNNNKYILISNTLQIFDNFFSISFHKKFFGFSKLKINMSRYFVRYLFKSVKTYFDVAIALFN